VILKLIMDIKVCCVPSKYILMSMMSLSITGYFLTKMDTAWGFAPVRCGMSLTVD